LPQPARRDVSVGWAANNLFGQPKYDDGSAAFDRDKATRKVLAAFETFRKEMPPEIGLAIDVHTLLDSVRAVQFCKDVERFRLFSFTEKSQRYITLGEDFVVPEEIRRAGKESLFVKIDGLNIHRVTEINLKEEGKGTAFFAKLAKDFEAQALELLDVDKLGLDDLDRRVLRAIMDKFGGGPVGLDTIAASISEEADTIEDVVEPYLLQLGFLDRTPRGRLATRRAYDHLGVAWPETPGQPSLL
jgi:hypothetical protein